jgi:hypothetical protein
MSQTGGRSTALQQQALRNRWRLDKAETVIFRWQNKLKFGRRRAQFSAQLCFHPGF